MTQFSDLQAAAREWGITPLHQAPSPVHGEGLYFKLEEVDLLFPPGLPLQLSIYQSTEAQEWVVPPDTLASLVPILMDVETEYQTSLQLPLPKDPPQRTRFQALIAAVVGDLEIQDWASSSGPPARGLLQLAEITEKVVATEVTWFRMGADGLTAGIALLAGGEVLLATPERARGYTNFTPEDAKRVLAERAIPRKTPQRSEPFYALWYLLEEALHGLWLEGLKNQGTGDEVPDDL